ncbi:heme exporter protein CcmD, partial [Pseudomonas reactans]|nr:heme exporter protein CcmD [Pseudomonas reactans]
MSFASFGDFLAMGHHGLYVWSAYGICLAVLVLNVAAPLLAHRRYLQQEA